MQDSLPAGGLRLCRAGVDPAGSLREVSAHLILLPRAFPGAIRVRLSPSVVIDEVIDVESFRRLVAVEAVQLPESPTATIEIGEFQVKQLDVPGLTYARDFLSESEEAALIAEINRNDWIGDLSRRVQHYGWRYNYKARRVDRSNYLGPLPKWAEFIVDRLVSSGLVPQRPDQLIVNEYIGDQGIGKHSDSESFADGIATISLLESWEMIFRDKVSNGNRKFIQRLDQRSVAVMSGASRSQWTHEIPSRQNEPDPNGKTKRSRKKRHRRVSLTFRKVIVPTDGG